VGVDRPLGSSECRKKSPARGRRGASNVKGMSAQSHDSRSGGRGSGCQARLAHYLSHIEHRVCITQDIGKATKASATGQDERITDSHHEYP
jgi:hypothetical protein